MVVLTELYYNAVLQGASDLQQSPNFAGRHSNPVSKSKQYGLLLTGMQEF
jgi:hypothetical protein